MRKRRNNNILFEIFMKINIKNHIIVNKMNTLKNRLNKRFR